MKPYQLTEENKKWLIKSIYNIQERGNNGNPKYSKMDSVHIRKYRETLSKGYSPNW